MSRAVTMDRMHLSLALSRYLDAGGTRLPPGLATNVCAAQNSAGDASHTKCSVAP